MTENQKEIARQWIAALRSGEYEQGKGYLKADGKYCCLGVLCDLYQKSRPDSPMTTDIEYDRESPYVPGETLTATSYDGCESMLPVGVMDWVGLWQPDGEFADIPTNADPRSLVGMNDNGHSFEVIANEIEADLARDIPLLFV